MDSSIKRGADHNLDFINILFEEWKFRLSQYWSITSKTVFIRFILFFIPYMKDAWGANTLNLPNQIFPVIGILFSIITCLLSTIEMNKINRIKASIKMYISKHSEHIDTPYGKGYDNKIHHNLPIAICCAQIVTGLFVLLSIS